MNNKNFDEKQEHFQKDVNNIRGTLAVEGIELGNNSIENLRRIAFEKTDYRQILNELRKKYKREA